jgi:hypothetical protein
MRKLILALLLLPVGSLTPLAQSPRLLSPAQLEVEALRGLDSIAVQVQSDVSRKGFEQDAIRESIESRLKSERLPIVAATKPHAGRLMVTLSQSGDVVLIRVRLFRLATMNCETANGFYTSMWEREKLSRLGGPESFTVQFDVSFLVDTFGAKYNQQNPR